jgi:hypothetical protein
VAAPRSYYMLISSLPQMPVRFDSGRVPVSWNTLRDRLRMLDPEDRAVTRQVGSYFLWDRQPLDRSDDEVIARYHELMKESGNPLVRHLIQSRTEMRLLLSAVRRQRAGLAPPSWAGKVKGAEALTSHVRKHWNQPHFNLGVHYRWVEAFTRFYDSGDVVEAQRVVFTQRWNDWTRIAEQHTFSFEAIIAYLVRWEIIDRWASQNAEAGKARFANLIEETLGEYADPV